ncbi:MAG TPA: DUF5677 domain-containing protein [Kofleriaceae bacterium]|nr:DUF5677 domain-containing protein [Kofleriaceae bacterium]
MAQAQHVEGRDRASIAREVEARCATELELLRELIGLAEQLIDEGGRIAKHDTHAIALLHVARAIKCLRALEDLALGGLPDDALGPIRTACELTIDLAYILAADSDARMEAYFAYEAVTNWKTAEPIAELHGTTGTDPYLPILKQRFEAVQARFPQIHKGWAQRSLAKKAKAADAAHFKDAEYPPLQRMYALAYHEGCTAIHAGAGGLRAAFESVPGGVTVRHGRHIAGVDRAITLSFLPLQLLLDLAAEQLGLPEQQQQHIRGFLGRVQQRLYPENDASLP